MILLGVTGSIAAYKSVELLRLLIKGGQEVHVVMTTSATKFVGPLTFQGISGHPVFFDMFDLEGYSMTHLALSEKADAVLVAPATAESLSQMAHGGARDLVSASVLSVPRTAAGKLKAPVFIAPAMHDSMWAHPATQANVKILKSFGYTILGPVKGALGRAGDSGEGRMVEPEVIAQQVLHVRARS